MNELHHLRPSSADGSALAEVERELELVMIRAMERRAAGYTATYFDLVARLSEIVRHFNAGSEALAPTKRSEVPNGR